MDNSHNENCDIIIEEVCIQFLDNRNIVVVISKHNGRKHTDAYVSFICEYFYSQPANQPLFLCFDISASSYSVYGVRRFIGLHSILGTSMHGRIGVVISNDAIGHSLKLFAHFHLQKPIHEREFFYRRDEAIQWLRTGLELNK